MEKEGDHLAADLFASHVQSQVPEKMVLQDRWSLIKVVLSYKFHFVSIASLDNFIFMTSLYNFS